MRSVGKISGQEVTESEMANTALDSKSRFHVNNMLLIIGEQN